MQYIVYKKFDDEAICGHIILPAATLCEERRGMIFYDGKPLCVIVSENAHQHFAVNEDGKGMYRGELIQKITSVLQTKDGDYQNRWNRVWEDKVCQKYKRPEHPCHWLWNHQFYNADIGDLEYILNLIQKR